MQRVQAQRSLPPLERTPSCVLRAVERLGPIALDPFATRDNPTGARRFLTSEENAFAHDWRLLAEGGLIYAFPPADQKLTRVVRHVSQQATQGCELVLLVPSYTDTSYVQLLFDAAMALCFWGSPLSSDDAARCTRREQLDLFDDAEPTLGWESPKGAWPALIAYWGARPATFRRAFQPHGAVLKPRRSMARNPRAEVTIPEPR